jgi:hypothetical protein
MLAHEASPRFLTRAAPGVKCKIAQRIEEATQRSRRELGIGEGDVKDIATAETREQDVLRDAFVPAATRAGKSRSA